MTIVTLQAVDLTPYGKPAFGRLPTGLGKPAAGFPQLHSLDDDEAHYLSHLGLTLYRGILSGSAKAEGRFTCKWRRSEALESPTAKDRITCQERKPEALERALQFGATRKRS